MLLCEDVIEKHKIPQKLVTQTLVHELIHAYDSCRAEVDWTNCLHIACSEVRAANLSGDCCFTNELNRGHFAMKGQGQECIKRRAGISVASHEQCKEKSQLAVKSVFDSCVADLSPFLNR